MSHQYTVVTDPITGKTSTRSAPATADAAAKVREARASLHRAIGSVDSAPSEPFAIDQHAAPTPSADSFMNARGPGAWLEWVNETDLADPPKGLRYARLFVRWRDGTESPQARPGGDFHWRQAGNEWFDIVAYKLAT